jgi:hypothetical protein
MKDIITEEQACQLAIDMWVDGEGNEIVNPENKEIKIFMEEIIPEHTHKLLQAKCNSWFFGHSKKSKSKKKKRYQTKS